jgi:hypothetical protein
MTHSQQLLNQCSQLLSDILQFVSTYNYDDYCRLESITNTHDAFCSRANELYENLVSILTKSSDFCVKKFKTDYFKFWWDQEGDLLKNNSISTHKEWCLYGRPNTGPIFEAKKRAKMQYKAYLRKNMATEKVEITNSLHDSLMSKNQDQFWKTWRSKFGVNKTKKPRINGLSDDSSIASTFADFFATVSNEEKDHTEPTQNLSSGFNLFTDYQVGSNTFDIETVSNVILDLKKGKASGLDNLASEHLQYCHPSVIATISILF